MIRWSLESRGVENGGTTLKTRQLLEDTGKYIRNDDDDDNDNDDDEEEEEGWGGGGGGGCTQV